MVGWTIWATHWTGETCIVQNNWRRMSKGSKEVVWKLQGSCKEAVWRRWSTEYLRGLQERHNQNQGTRTMSLREGDVVIIKSDERNRAKWPLGIVENLYKGRDDMIRAVRLRAGKTFLERPPTHLYPLELSCDRKRKKPSEPLNPTVPPFRPTRDAAAAASQRIQEIMNNERWTLTLWTFIDYSTVYSKWQSNHITMSNSLLNTYISTSELYGGSVLETSTFIIGIKQYYT